MRISHSKLLTLAIHQGGKAFDAATDIARQRAAHIIRAFNHQDLEQFPAGVFLARFEIKFGWLTSPVITGDRDGLIKVAGIQDTQCSNDFLSGCNGSPLIGILCIEVAIRGQIYHYYAFRGNLRRGSAWGHSCPVDIWLEDSTAQWRLWIASA